VEPVNSLSQVLAILRRQMSERSGKLGTRSPVAASRSPESASGSEAFLEVQRKVRERIRAIDPGDERRQSKAVRFFLEGVLQHEFGDSMLTDPAFFTLIDDVQTAMESDAGIDQTLRQMVKEISENPRA
jgi:hypothetical protein